MTLTRLSLFSVLLAALGAAPALTAEESSDAALPLHGRVQSLSMHRDIDGKGQGWNTTLGTGIGWVSPTWKNLRAGVTGHAAVEAASGGKESILANDGFALLTEAWAEHQTSSHALWAGRRVLNNEIFRADDFRQKPRAIEGFAGTQTFGASHTLQAGHTFRLSNWILASDKWRFQDIEEVMGTGDASDGITWGQLDLQGPGSVQLVLSNATAWEIANLTAVKARWTPDDTWSLEGTYRHEEGQGHEPDANAGGVMFDGDAGRVHCMTGWFQVRGATLRFQETTTGIAHPLGATMILLESPFAGETDTYFLKLSGSCSSLNWLLLAQQGHHHAAGVTGREVDVILSQPLRKDLKLTGKAGWAESRKDAAPDQEALDLRVFLTWTF